MLAIDIGTKTVTVAEGGRRGNTAVIGAWASEEFETEFDLGDITKNRAPLVLFLNRLIKTNRLRSKNAVVVFHSGDVVTREFKMPAVKPAQLSLLVRNEMARILGEDSGYVYDYVVNVVEGNSCTVTAYAAPEESVRAYRDLVTELGLRPAALDVQVHALSKLFTGAEINGEPFRRGHVIVADVGYSKITFLGFTEGKPRFNRADLSPMQEFVREIGSVLRLDAGRNVLAELDFSPEAEHENLIVADTCKYFVYRLAEEFQRYVQYLYMNSELKTVDKIYLCGGAAALRGMDAALGERLRVPTETVRSVSRLQVPAGCDVSSVCSVAGALLRYSD